MASIYGSTPGELSFAGKFCAPPRPARASASRVEKIHDAEDADESAFVIDDETFLATRAHHQVDGGLHRSLGQANGQMEALHPSQGRGLPHFRPFEVIEEVFPGEGAVEATVGPHEGIDAEAALAEQGEGLAHGAVGP